MWCGIEVVGGMRASLVKGIKSWKACLIKRHGLWATYHSLYVCRYERLHRHCENLSRR